MLRTGQLPSATCPSTAARPVRPQGSGEAALDVELASYNAPSASLLVYEAPNDNDAQSLDLFNAIASQDAAQVVTTSWGNCEQFINGSDPNYIPEREPDLPTYGAAGPDGHRRLG